jgi:toxin YoeB
VLKRVNSLIEATMRDPFGGIGKPEQLKHVLAGAWSRRITEEHRLVYKVDGDDLIVLQARYHYTA